MNTKLLFEEPRNIGELEKGLNVLLHVEDEHGRRIVSKKAQTLITAFYRILYARMGTGTPSAVDINGTSYTLKQGGIDSYNLDFFNVKGASGDTSLGIIVGTSTTPVSITDYRLGALISHGTGAGQLLYGGVSVVAIEVTGNMARFYVTRLLTNNSGADITVNEVGLVGSARDTGGFGRCFLLDRTRATFIVPNGGSRNVIYEFRVVV
jgi:hypothetical protein